MSGRPVYGADGGFCGYRGVGRDITAAVEAQEALRASERRFADVVDAAGEFVWEVDGAGRFVYASDKVESVLGYAPLELLGRHPKDLAPAQEAERVADWMREIGAERKPFRSFEYLSEDPLLGGRLAAAMVRGIQSQGVGTSVKHYAVNNQESHRLVVDAVVDERTLRELYLRGFEIAVTESDPWTVMCSYNRVNGTYASDHTELLTTILRDEWGYGGLVMSDWGATNDRVAGVTAGMDLEMPGPARWMGQHALEAVRSGALSEERLNDKVRRLLRTLERAGVFDHPELQPEQAIDRPGLQLPHPRIAERAFVLAPLAEIAPDRMIGGRTVVKLLEAVADDTIRRDTDATDRLLALLAG